MGKKPKKLKVHTDERGHFVWENFFVRGKQRRRKQRVTVIDGEIVNDLDGWLRANADDVFLHQIERWDLIEQRQLEEEGTLTEEPAMKPPPRKRRLDIVELESAFEFGCRVNPNFCDEPCISFLDLTTGKIVASEDEKETETLFVDGNHLVLPDDLFEGLEYGALDEFVDSLPDDRLRGQLARAIRGKGAFRHFKDIVFGGGNVELKHRWSWFESRRRRERIVEWLRDENIESDWGCDIFEPPPLPNKRGDLLRAVLAFVRDARAIPGVRRIALLGSLTTLKAIPKDVDVLVEVSDDLPLDQLARLSRRLLAAAMQTGDGCGADVFSAIRKANSSAACVRGNNAHRASGRLVRHSTAEGGPTSTTTSKTSASIPRSSPNPRSNSGPKSSPAPKFRTMCKTNSSPACGFIEEPHPRL